MSKNPSLDDIMTAVKKSGYLMEQEVATLFECNEFHVNTNVAFQDVDEDKSREIDVKAIKRVGHNIEKKLAAYVELIVECKNTNNPFVFIGRPKNAFDNNTPPEEFIIPFNYREVFETSAGRRTSKELDAFRHLGFDDIHLEHKNEWKAVQFCRIDRKGADWHANHGGLYDALFYPMAKALVSRKREVPKNNDRNEWQFFWFFFPIVVTSGDIFLIDSTATEPEPVTVEFVTFKRELKTTNLKGKYNVTFVKQDSLDKFLDKVVTPMANQLFELVENQPKFVRQTEVSKSAE